MIKDNFPKFGDENVHIKTRSFPKWEELSVVSVVKKNDILQLLTR